MDILDTLAYWIPPLLSGLTSRKRGVMAQVQDSDSEFQLNMWYVSLRRNHMKLIKHRQHLSIWKSHVDWCKASQMMYLMF